MISQSPLRLKCSLRSVLCTFTRVQFSKDRFKWKPLKLTSSCSFIHFSCKTTTKIHVFEVRTAFSYFEQKKKAILKTWLKFTCTLKREKEKESIINVLLLDEFRYSLIMSQCEVMCQCRFQRILNNTIRPNHSLFTLLPSGNRYRSICCCITVPSGCEIPQYILLSIE